jgi:hypothetical protein
MAGAVGQQLRNLALARPGAAVSRMLEPATILAVAAFIAALARLILALRGLAPESFWADSVEELTGDWQVFIKKPRGEAEAKEKAAN